MRNFLIAAGKKIRKILQGSQRRAKKKNEQLLSDTELPVTVPDADSSPGSQAENDVVKSPKKRRSRPKTRKRSEAATSEVASWSLDAFNVVPVPGKSRFHDYEVPLEVMRAIADLEFQYCTPIQQKSLKAVLDGSDLVGKAHTGTGKTAVFLIAILSRLLQEDNEKKGQSRHKKSGTRALVLAPTRELVMQIAEEARRLGKYCELGIHAVYGGVDYQKQLNALQNSRSDIVVATPGRLLDFVGKRVVALDKCRILVLDEADRMLDMGFIPDVRRIVGRLPEPGVRQTMLFSATVPDDVQRLAYQWCVKPEVVEAESDQVSVDSIEQFFYLATTEEKYTILMNLIQSHPEDRILVFANMKNETRRLAERLQRDGVECVLLSGDVAQDKRVKRLESFRAGRVKVLVATDVAGRGIHIDDITMVVNYMLPYEPEDYVHRIGRTGRAGASGVAISFACEQGAFYLPAIEEFLGRKIECTLPEESLFAEPVIKRTKIKQQAASIKQPRRRSNNTNRPRRRRKPAATRKEGEASRAE